MSSINPVPQQSVIKLARGVQWDNSYKDIRLFRTESEREQYFSPKLANVWTNCSVVKENQIMLGGNMQEYLSCNYMIFTNNGFANAKTFYCFITSIDYVNVNAFRVTYEIDWVQSFLFDFKFELCYVEREHVSDDTFGKNRVDEHEDVGEYMIEKIRNHTDNPAFVMYVAGEDINMKQYGQVVSALDGIGGNLGDTEAFNDVIRAFTDAPEKVAMFSMCTSKMLNNGVADAGFIDGFTVLRDKKIFESNGVAYTPQNNKMLCYPYKFFTIDNYDGNSQEFMWEDCQDQLGVPKCDFAFRGTAVPKPCLICYPYNYKNWTGDGISGSGVQNFALTYNNFPEVPWINDTFRAWISQYQSSIGVNAGATVAQTVLGIASAMASKSPTGQAVGVGLSFLSAGKEVANLYQEQKEHSIHSRQIHGSIGSSAMNFQMKNIGFREVQYGITAEYAIRIDQKFTRYGYRVDAVKVPNTRGREYFNYVKCHDAHVDGNIPVDAKNVMENAMQNGVTFWHVNNIGATYRTNPIV